MTTIAIVIPTYNRDLSIAAAVQSVLVQHGDFDLKVIIVDDASTDKTLDVCRAIASVDPRVELLALDANVGAPTCRNRGILAATESEFVGFQDSDDVWLPGKLARQVEVLRNGKYAATACRVARISSQGLEISPSPPGRSGELSQVDLLSKNYVSTQALCVRADVIRETLFDPLLPRFQDWELAIRLAGSYRMHIDDWIGVVAPVSPNSITRSADSGFKARIEILKKHKSAYAKSPLAKVKMQLVTALTAGLAKGDRSAKLAALTAAGVSPTVARASTSRLASNIVSATGKGRR